MPAPTVVRSKGPNGTHSATRAPWIGDTPNYTGTMRPSGAGGYYTSKDFQDAWDKAHAAAPNGTAIVWMEDGKIRGYGGKASSTAALSSIGKLGRATRVLFYPRSGWAPRGATGGVHLTDSSARLFKIYGTTIAGLRGGPNNEFGILTTACRDFGLWRSTAGYFNNSGAQDSTTEDIDLDECVVPYMRVYESDSSADRSASDTTTGPLFRVRRRGCYFAPTYRPTGTDSHTDTVQFSGDSPYSGFLIEDTTIVGSTNHGLIVGGAGDVVLKNVDVVAGYAGKLLFPPAGKALPPSKYAGNNVGTVNDPIALNGSGQAGQLDLTDVTLFGRIKNAFSGMRGSDLVNVRCSDRESAGYDSRIVYDASLANMTVSQLLARCPRPTDAYLSSIWNGTAAPEPENPGEPPVENPGPVVPPPPADTVDPEVTWITPEGPVSGTASLVVEATDNVAVDSVVFSTIFAGTRAVLPGVTRSGDRYTLSFNTKGAPDGTYVVTATATDTSGRKKAATRSFVVNNSGTVSPTNRPPVVTFVEPAVSAVLPFEEVVQLAASATDDFYVASVEFYAVTASGRVRIGEASPSALTPDLYGLSVTGGSLPAGLLGLVAKATDSGGLSAETPIRYVTVAPRVDSSAPGDFTARLVEARPRLYRIAWTEAVDQAGQPVSYRVYYDELLVTTVESLSYAFEGVTPSAEGVKVRVEAFDPDGNTTTANELTLYPAADPEPPVEPPVTPPSDGITVRAAAVPDGRPAPYVDLTVTGIPAGAATATLFRRADGRLYKVRGFVKKSKFGVLAGRDFEAPLGREAAYYAEFYDLAGQPVYTTPTVAVTLPSDLRRGAVVHGVLDPAGSVVLTLASSALASLSRAATLTSVNRAGRSAPAVLGGVRGALAGLSIDAYTSTPEDTAKLWAALGGYDVDTAGVLCVRLGPDAPLPGTLYLAVSAPEARPLNAQQGGGDTLWVLAADEVAPPTPALVVPVLSYADFTRALRAYGENYADFAAAYATYRAATRDTKVGTWE